MENQYFTVGLVIADKDEYVHLEKFLEPDAAAVSIQGLVGHTFTVKGKTQNIRVRTICTGIGKVNATVGATLLAEGSDMLLSAGLSGGFDETSKNDIVLGTRFYEHDFDLTTIGYELSQKSHNDKPIVSACELNSDIVKKFPFVKQGVFVTGDCFISSKEKHDFLKKTFNPIACDMESAAVGYVASVFDLPFVSLRMVSDGANDDSAKAYADTLGCDTADLWLKIVFDWIKSL